MRDATQTKKRILDAAEKVFARKGLAGARIQEIADRARVNSALVHRYYISKEKLYLKVIENALERMSRFETLIASPQGSYRERLCQFIETGFDFCHENRSYIHLVQRDIADGGFGLRKTQARFRPLLAKGVQFFQEGMDEGYIKEDDPRDLVFTLYSMVTQYFYQDPILASLWKQGPISKTRLRRRKEHIKRVFCNLLVG